MTHTDDAQSAHTVDTFASLTTGEKLKLRGAFCDVLSALQMRIDETYRAGDYNSEGILCDAFLAVLRQFNRCDPYPTAVRA